MSYFRKAALVIGYEGVTGLLGRAVKRAFAPKLTFEFTLPTTDYATRKKEFAQQVKKKVGAEVGNFLWYHTIDLGNGLVTPGQYDFRDLVTHYGFPDDMSGMRVLDVGSATGFFAFEFEKRGAEVVSVELPSILDWDMPLSEERECTLSELKAFHGVDTVEELNRVHLHGPFEFCHKLRGSKIKRVYSTAYDLNLEKVGGKTFDLVFAGSLLVHTFSPLKILSVLAPLCHGKLIVSQPIPNLLEDQSRPTMLYAGGDEPHGDARTWWYPNHLCITQMLKRLGFTSVEKVSHFEGIAYTDEQYSTHHYKMDVLHATK